MKKYLLSLMLMVLFAPFALFSQNVDFSQQYRIKSTSTNKYINVFNNTMNSNSAYGGVGAATLDEESASQIFTFEDAGNGQMYLLSADGHYIKCWSWNVDAYSTTDKTALRLINAGNNTFYVINTANDKYFKLEYVSDPGEYIIFCDCTDSCQETWKLEAVGNNEEGEDGDDGEPEEPGDETPNVPILSEDGKLVMYPGTNYTYTLQFTIIEGTNNCSVKCSVFPNAQINLEIPSEVKMGETVYTVTTIENDAFGSYYINNHNYNFIGNLVIPNSVTTVGDYAFYYCHNLNGTLTLSENLETIGNNAFDYCCEFIGDLVIPNSVTTVGDYAFYRCTNFNGTLTLSENLETIGNSTFYNCSKLTGDLVIPNSVTSIGAGAFMDCSNFNGTLTLSENLETIANSTFDNCSKLTGDLVIPNSVTSIGAEAFWNCSNFNGTLTLSENLETIANSAFYYCSKLTGNLVIPNSVTSIGENAFYYCYNFNGTLILSENLETIGKYAFAGNNGSSKMKFTGNLVIPNSVTSIGNYAFYYCSNFDGTLIIPENLEIIPQYAFSYCSGIDVLILSNNVKSIGNNSFANCTSLKTVISEATTPPSATSSTFSSSGLTNIFVLEEYVDTYSSTSPWSNYNVSAIPNIEDYEVEVIENEVVLYSLLYNLTEDGLSLDVKIGQAPTTNVELIIPASVDVNNSGYVLDVVSIADNAFKDDTQDENGCELFTKISLPITIKSIGDNAFAGCSDVEEIVSFAESAPVTGENCFEGITGADLYVKSFNEYNKAPWNAFNIKPYINNYEYNSNGYSLIFNLLSDNSGLEVRIGQTPTSNVSLNIPESISFDDFGITYNVVRIADSAFYNCYNFTGDLVIPNSVTSIGDYAFYYCYNFNGNLTLSENLETIGKYAFAAYNYNSIMKFTGNLVIPNSVTSIGDYAFYYCSNFNGNLTLSENLETIGNKAFYSCSKFTGDLVIPNSVTSIGDYAFYYCSNFTGDLVIPNSVTSIGDYAFYYCYNFNGNLTLSENLETIGNNAFYYCSNLQKMISNAVVPPTANSNSFSGAFSSGRILFVPEESVDAYSGVSPWSGFSIYAIPNLTNHVVEYKDGDNVLYSLVFNLNDDESGLEVKIGQAPITSVELTIPEKIEFNPYYIYDVVSIADNAFKDDTQDETGCELFTTINIPSKIESIGDNAFAGCIGTTNIKSSALVAPATGENCFEGISNTTNLFVLNEASGYDVAPWNNFNTIILAPITDYVYEVKDENENVLYTLIFNTLSDYSGLEVKVGQAPSSSVELNIPESIYFEEYNNTYNVVSIAENAFRECVNFVGDLVIPNTVTTIGIAAFYECWGFNGTLTLPDNLLTIGDFAFAGYEANMSFVGELIIPNTVTTIGQSAFQNSVGFTGDLIIPEGVVNIAQYAFYRCQGFTGTLTLPENLTTISQYAFYNCKFDGALVIPSSVTSIGSYAFQYCTGFDFVACASLTPPSASSNTFYNSNLNTLYVQEEAVNAYNNKSPWYNFNIYAAVPFVSDLVESAISCSTEKYIDVEMFNCSINEISSIKFEVVVDDVKIEEFTWEGNIAPFKVENIERSIELALGTHNLTVNITEINGVEFESSKTIEIVSEETKYACVEGESGEFIIDVMKYNNNNSYTWELLASDGSVIATNNVTSSNMLNTASVSINAGECVRFVIKRSNSSSYNTTEGYFRIIDGKGNVVLFEEGEFAQRTSYLLSVNSDEDVEESYAENTFVVNLETPELLSYKLATMAEQWSDVHVLKVNGSMNSEDMEVLYKLSNIAILDLSQTDITNISSCNNLSKLRNVILPSTVTAVEDQAFYNCKSLKSINIPNVTEIGNSAFYCCYSLSSIETPNVTTIGNSAFYYCYSLQSINLPNITSLGSSNNSSYGVFEYCNSLSTVNLSDKLTVIPYSCFENCSNLKEINLPSSLKTISSYAFYYCSLTDIAIPEGVTTIGYYAFRNCPLTNISIPSTIEYIDYSSFYNCNVIADVYCYAIAPLTTDAFNGGISTATLHVPAVSVISYRLHDSWYNFENIVPIDGDIVDVNINSDFTIVNYDGFADEVNLNLNMNAHLTVSAESEFNINNYTQLCSNTAYYTNTGGQQIYYYPSTLITDTEMNANNVEVTLNLRTNRWNFISLPFDVDITDVEFPEGTLWVVRKYSGEDRANMSENTWHNVTDGMTMNAGEGYILHCIRDDYNFVRFTFKALDNDNKNNIFANQDVEQALEIYPSEFAHNRSWNLVGNPYPSYFNTNGNIEHNGIITVWDNGYVAYSLLDDYFTLKPYESFFVQCPDDANSMLFKTEGRSHTNDYDDYNKRMEAFKQRNSGERKIYNITLNNEDYSDKTRLVINENASAEYELSCDASKFMNEDENVPQIYVYDNEIRYAINERPLLSGSMTLGIRVGQEGEYTLTLNPKDDYGMKVILLDTETNEVIDILENPYTFTAETGYDDDRFALSIVDINVGIEEEYILDHQDPEVEIFDIFGRKVTNPENGLYILRKGDKVQKCFIGE